MKRLRVCINKCFLILKTNKEALPRFKRECVCVCVREKVCVNERVRERESESECVRERERESESECVRERERERETERDSLSRLYIRVQ